jgi:hypothetical protein
MDRSEMNEEILYEAEWLVGVEIFNERAWVRFEQTSDGYINYWYELISE